MIIIFGTYRPIELFGQRDHYHILTIQPGRVPLD